MRLRTIYRFPNFFYIKKKNTLHFIFLIPGDLCPSWRRGRPLLHPRVQGPRLRLLPVQEDQPVPRHQGNPGEGGHAGRDNQVEFLKIVFFLSVEKPCVRA